MKVVHGKKLNLAEDKNPENNVFVLLGQDYFSGNKKNFLVP